MADIRDLASEYNSLYRWWTSYRRFTAYTDIGTDGSEDDDGEPIQRKISIHYVVCPVCDGRGSYVNPNIDRHGLTREDFDEDPDFAEDYMSGRFDIVCALCHGSNVIPEASKETEREELAAALDKAYEPPEY